MGGLTRKELLAGAAAAGVVAGCGGSSAKPAAFDPGDWAIGQGAVPARTRASVTSTRSCSPRTRSRSATRSSATGAGSTPTRPVTCTRTRPSSTSGCSTRRRATSTCRRSSRSRTRRRWGSGSSTAASGSRAGRSPRARLLLDARVAAPALREVPADPALRRSGAGHGDGDGRGRPRRRRRGRARAHLGPLRHGRQDPGTGDRRGGAARLSWCSTASTASPPTTCRSTRSTCSWPAPTSGSAARAEPGSCGAGSGTGCARSSRPSTPDRRLRAGTPAATTRSSTAGRSPRRSTSTTGSAAPR